MLNFIAAIIGWIIALFVVAGVFTIIFGIPVVAVIAAVYWLIF